MPSFLVKKIKFNNNNQQTPYISIHQFVIGDTHSRIMIDSNIPLKMVGI